MSDPNDYLDEMRRLSRISEHDIERLLAGKAPAGDGSLEELADFLGAAGYALMEAPQESVAARHLAELEKASKLLADKGEPVARPVSNAPRPDRQASGLPKWRRVIDVTKTLLLKGAAATVAASLSMVGLAYAGVDLPGSAAEEAIESVLGVELPNQGDEGNESDAVSDDVQDVIDSTDERDCAFGQAVADAADQNRDDESADGEDPCAAGDEGRATGEQKSAEGRATADEKGAEGRATGDDAAESGEANRSIGDDAAESGEANRDRGDDAAESGEANRDRGDDAAESGEANRERGDDARENGSDRP